jgi:hypothetical protein
MKTLMIKLISMLLLFYSLAVFAEKMLITGMPVILVPAMNYYTFPKYFSPRANYHFVDIQGDNRVCFLNVRPDLAELDLLRIFIVQDGRKYLWYCYRYDPRYFTMNY